MSKPSSKQVILTSPDFSRAKEDSAAAAIERLFPGNPEASNITIECNRKDYSASAIARAVEDCDAHVLNLNVTSQEPANVDGVVVDLRVDHRNAGAVARSLERYGYIVVASSDTVEDPMMARARSHAMELLHYLEN